VGSAGNVYVADSLNNRIRLLTPGAALMMQTITFAVLSNVTLGVPPFTITATASSGLTVTFTSTTPSICTVSGNTVTIVAVGTCSITASQAGNSIYAAATPVTQSFTVVALTVETYDLVGVTLSDGGTLTGSFDWAYGGGAYEFTNINIVATGAGPDLGEVLTIANGTDSNNNGGECLVYPQEAFSGDCSPLSGAGILLNFVNRLGPNDVFPTERVQFSDLICTANAGNCGLGQGFEGTVGTPSEVVFSSTVQASITGGAVVHRLETRAPDRPIGTGR
jgi:hypothetical protein